MDNGLELGTGNPKAMLQYVLFWDSFLQMTFTILQCLQLSIKMALALQMTHLVASNFRGLEIKSNQFCKWLAKNLAFYLN